MPMRATRIVTCLCGAFLCCVGMASGQSGGAIGGQVAAAVGGTAGAAVDASVSGSAMRGQGAGRSGSGRLSAGDGAAESESTQRGLASARAARNRATFGSSMRGTAARQMTHGGAAERVSESDLRSREAKALRAYKTQHAGGAALESTAAKRVAKGSRGFSAEQQTGSRRSGVSGMGGSYSTGFPDSTKGTALVSPPELGTTSPLEWTPSLSFALPDFSARQFLSPTLHPGRRSGMRGAERAGGFGRPGNLPGKSLLPTPLHDDGLGSDLPDSSFSSDTALPTSIDQQ